VAAWAALSARQRDIAHHVARGMTSKQIARVLTISPLTVAKHRRNIFAALNVHSMAKLASQIMTVSSASTTSE
jgi:DNA-binding CsgD family transcriptional regulator